MLRGGDSVNLDRRKQDYEGINNSIIKRKPKVKNWKPFIKQLIL